MNHGGKRAGAGRKPGQLEQKTIERIRIKKMLDQRIMRHTDDLFTAQFSLAIGSTYIYRVEEKPLRDGKTKKEHVLVTDPEEIKRVLNAGDGFGNSKIGEDYYIVTTSAPDNRAIDSLLDRAFGKAQQAIEIIDENHAESEDLRIMLSFRSIKDMIELFGLSFEQAVAEYFGVVMPEDADIKDAVIQKLESELVQ